MTCMRHGCIEARDKLLAERDLSAEQARQRAREIARLREIISEVASSLRKHDNERASCDYYADELERALSPNDGFSREPR